MAMKGNCHKFDLMVKNSLTDQSALNTLIKVLSSKKYTSILLIVESLTKSLAYFLKNNNIYFLDTSGEHVHTNQSSLCVYTE